MPGGKKEEYDVIGDIGSGSFGVCQKVRRKSDRKVLAWKVIEYGGMSESEKQQLVREVNLLREFRHKHIVRYYDRIIDKCSSRLYIVMEYCSGGDLSSLIAKTKRERKYLGEEFVWRVLYQLLLAMAECHKKRESEEGGKVLHRDIKPANVFIDSNGDIKLGDFGLARILHDTSLAKTFVGTPYYTSPEQFQCISYDHKSDVWSLGCLFYELCALSPPFLARNERDLMVKVCHGYFSRIPVCYSKELHATIASLLHVDPDRRPTVPELLKITREHRTTTAVSMSREEYQTRVTELKEREQALIERERMLYQKEKELKQKEKTINLREEQLKSRERDMLVLPAQMDELDKKLARIRLPLRRKENQYPLT